MFSKFSMLIMGFYFIGVDLCVDLCFIGIAEEIRFLLSTSSNF